MPTTTDDPTTPTVDEQFLDLVCNDTELLAAEFDAIITAAWPDPPTGRRGRGAAGGQPGSGAARRAGDPTRGPIRRPRHPGIGGWARQRSPPLPDRPTTGRKAGDRPT